MKRILNWLIYVPVVLVSLVILMFAVANRSPVLVSLDPFNAAAPAVTFKIPLFLLLFLTLMLGVLVGGCAAWLKQGRSRRAGRQARAEAERHRAEVERLRATRVPASELPVIAPF